ncbi:MAG: metallophosphoesterase [Alphaproteobacteria bacterium]|nr:metallophosphoesterase [Alphaproteobacteria bacterium]
MRAELLLALLAGCGDSEPAQDSTPEAPAAEPEHVFTFAVLADPHITAPSERDQRLAAAVAWINAQAEARKIEVVMVVGDIGWGEGLVGARDLLDALEPPYVPVLGDNEVHFGDEENFDLVFEPQYARLAETFEDWQRAPTGTWNPEWEQTSWFQNFSFTHKGLHFVGLDWVSRDSHQIFGELGELHDFEGGTLPWFGEALSGLPEGIEEDTVLFSHHPMHVPSFDLAQLAQITAVTSPLEGRVAAAYAGHYHGNHEEEIEDGGYMLFVTDATWDDEDTVRVVEVWSDGQRFEFTQELVEVAWR